MGSCTLNWFSDRGFELDVEAAEDGVALRLVNVPVPADGTAELRSGVELDRLDILFKANVEIEGEPAQLHDARVQLVEDEDGTALDIDAHCEDIDTGDLLPVRLRLEVRLPAGAPERGGPRPVPTNEDDLDWEDETTLEQLVVNAPEAAATEERAPTGAGRGLQALFQALASLDSEDEGPLEDETGEVPAPPAKPAAGRPAPGRNAPRPVEPEEPEEPEEGDQSLGAAGEARSLLDLLVRQESLELEDDADLDELSEGVAEILALRVSSEAKASRLSEWLLEQEGVADLFIGDDDLAVILERW